MLTVEELEEENFIELAFAGGLEKSIQRCYKKTVAKQLDLKTDIAVGALTHSVKGSDTSFKVC